MQERAVLAFCVEFDAILNCCCFGVWTFWTTLSI